MIKSGVTPPHLGEQIGTAARQTDVQCTLERVCVYVCVYKSQTGSFQHPAENRGGRKRQGREGVGEGLKNRAAEGYLKTKRHG